MAILRVFVSCAIALPAAVCSQDAVLSALGYKRYFHPRRILSEGTRHILRVMEAHEVARLV